MQKIKKKLKDLKLLARTFKVISNTSSEQLLRFEYLRKIGQILLPEYRFKWPQMEWWHNDTFNEYLKHFNEIEGANTDRYWMLYQLLRLVENVPGDTAECGVFQGTSSYLICKRNRESKIYQRFHHMFDSFEGLSEPSNLDGTHWKKGDLACGVDIVKQKLTDCNNFNLYPGWIPERFVDVEDKKFSFVHIDVDLYQPTLESIKFFYPRINPGGIILCDDYGFTTCIGATQAINEFLSYKPEKMISLSAGGGFMIKNCLTSDH